MGLLDTICRICMQQDMLLNCVQPMDEKMTVIYDVLFKSARVQMVCSPCEQELRRSYRFFSLCSRTSEVLFSVCDKDGAVCVEPPNHDRDVTPGVIDFANKDEETLEDLDYLYTDNDSVDKSTDEVDFENWHSKIDKVVDLTLEKDVQDKVAETKPENEDGINAKDADKVEVSSNVEKTDINVEKYEGRKGEPQFDEDIKIEISDHELELVKEEPPVFITSEQSNDSSDVIETAVISLPKIVIPKIKCYPCGLCEEAFIKDTARQRHVRENHQEVITVSGEKIRYKCEVCDKKFSTRAYLNQHFKFHTGRNLLECYTCQKKFLTKAMLAIHVRKHLKTKEFECERCKMRFNQRQSIRKHQLNVCGQSNEVECKVCSRVVHKRNLNSHMKLHERPEYYTCRLCNKSFDHKYKLRNHVRTHTGEKLAQCDICKLKFTQKHSLIAHMRIHNGERPFKCKLCDSAFTMVGNLQRHMKVHSDEKPYKCDICNRRYKDETNLNYHKLRHNGIRPYSCKVCDKAFFTSTELRDHLTTHTGEKPYKCDICPRTFACEKYLKNHVRLHKNPPKGYTCDICDTKVKFRVNFLRHIRAHTDKTRFTCDICGQHLSSNDYLKEHRKLHFGIKALQCQCGEHFIIKRKFRDHLREYPDHKLVKGSLKRLKRLSKKTL